tara:strand:+ start:321 stop:473 length:153 start_codon:yes stop_codon:yes gene_type:complete
MDQEEDIDIEERQVILDVITELLAIQLEELLNIVGVGVAKYCYCRSPRRR